MILINFYAGAQMSNHSDKKSPNWGFNGVLKCGDLSKSNGFQKWSYILNEINFLRRYHAKINLDPVGKSNAKKDLSKYSFRSEM